ncbi:cellobiose 2-epimerase [Bacteroidia bacterium]|nr:cellobiose 2-epimerase [Bacteroidia bacterium]
MSSCEVGGFVDALRRELTGDILPFWMNRMVDAKNGGFLSRIACSGRPTEDAPKGAVLNARLLWTFAAAYRVLGGREYLDMATRARDYLLEHFIDGQYGGVYWSLDHTGRPLETKKQTYAIGFAIYGLSEYHRATGDGQSLRVAIDLFHAIERHAFDELYGGYVEALDRRWQPLEDMRLSEKDANLSKTMNTHLHIIEPYTNLYRVWKDPLLERRVRDLLSVFVDKIIQGDGHLGLFFDERWQLQSNIVSYGHDIEASWLLHEASLELGDADWLQAVEPLVIKIADAAAQGIQADGSIIYEHDRTAGHYDRDRHWWPQAEAVVGYYNIYQHFGDRNALRRAMAAWQYIDRHMIDRTAGEWHWSILPDGSPNTREDKAGFWKCPYHNSRMALELIERTERS